VSLSDKVKSHIVVNAGYDDRQLRWDFRPGKLSVSSLDSHSDTFQVLYDKINRITVNFAPQSSDVVINTQAGQTDFILNFPETDGDVNNKLTIVGSPASILVNGPVDVLKIGSQDSLGYKTPFANIGGMVAVSHDAIIHLDSSKSVNVENHIYRMNSLCLVDAAGQNSTNWKSISPWIREQITALGMKVPEDGAECSLLYNSNANQMLEINTGNGADSFDADGASIPVTLSLGGNADQVNLKNTNGVQFTVDLGTGADVLNIENTGDVYADLGDDKNTDVVNVFYKEDSPNIDGNTIYPVGNDNAKLTLNHWLQQDLISVHRDSDKRNVNNRFRAGLQVLKVINASTPGTTIRYEQESDTTYLVVGCANMVVISFDVYSSNSTSIAKNANTYVSLTDVSNRCTVDVNSELNANGTAGILIPDDMESPPRVMRMERSNDPPGTGSFTYGSLRILPTNVAHFEVSIPSTLRDGGRVDVSDAPSNADVIISTPGPEWVVNLMSLHNTAVILDATTQTSDAILQSNVPVIIGGNSGNSVVYANAKQAEKVVFVSGCLVTEDGQRGHSVSNWIIYRTLNQYNVSIGFSHTCNVEIMNVSALYIGNCSTVNVGGLTSDFTTQVYVVDESEVDLTVDPDIQDVNLMKTYGSWSDVKYNGFYNGTNRFAAKRSNGQTFVIDVVDAQKVSVNRGVTQFVVGSSLEIDCANGTTNAQLNMHNDFSNEVQMHASMTVTSDKCIAVINNMISKNTSIAPAVVLGHGLKMDMSMTMLPPLDPDTNAVVEIETDASSPVRSLVIATNATTKRTKYVLSETTDDNKTIALVDAEWDSDLTKDIAHDLQDTAEYVLDFDAQIVDSKYVHMNISAGAKLSFGDLHDSTVLFVSAKTSDFTPEKRQFSLAPSNTSGDYCFDPCQDCTEGAWGRIVISGRICQPRSAQDSCKERAKVVINITGALEGVSCGAASFDTDRNETCAFAMNSDGHKNGVLVVPDPVMLGTTIVIAFSILLTIIGASSLIARLVFACKGYSSINIWWTHNTFRDLLTDQFSWAAIVITACIPQVVDVDFAQWGGWVVAIMMRAKTFVLEWFVTCSVDGEPEWVTPATIVFWCVTFISVVLRIVELILSKLETELSSPVKNAILAVQSVLTVTGFLLMPLVGYSLAFLNSSSYAGFASAVCIVLLFISQPIGGANRSCFTGIVASVLNVLIPLALCIFVGVGAEFVPAISFAIACVVILPVCDMVVLWLVFFRKAVLHTSAWKHSLGWTLALRIVSTLCGLAFFIMLFFELSDEMSKVAATLWFVWVCLPFLAVIPLTAGVPSVLSATEVVPIRKSVFGAKGDVTKEGSPLLGIIQDDDDDGDSAGKL